MHHVLLCFLLSSPTLLKLILGLLKLNAKWVEAGGLGRIVLL